MKRVAYLLLGLFCATQSATAQDAAEVFTLLDGLYVIAEPAPVLSAGNVYRVPVYQSYPTPLYRFRIDGVCEGLSVRVEPPEVPKLMIGEYREFNIHVAPLPGAELAGDRITVLLSFDADELDSDATWPLVIPLTAAAEKELREADAKTVGTVKVRVRWWAGWEHWVYVLGSIGVIAAVAWRHWRARKPRKDAAQ